MPCISFNQFLNSHKNELRTFSDHIHSHPELGGHEFEAVKTVTEFLTERNLPIVHNYCHLETAWRSEYGCGSPVFAFASEFDALPGIGHGCGHNLICTVGLAAYWAVAERLKATGQPGKIILLGTPDEEDQGGKVMMMKENCLNGIDAVMMAHPSSLTIPDMGCMAISPFIVTFHGKSAHAAASPELGVNALDAVMLLFAAVNAYRQQLPESARIHGIVREGGKAPNIIPDRATCEFFLRACDQSWMNRINQRFMDMVHGAELMTGTQAEITPENAYMSRKPNGPMNQCYLEAVQKAGLTPCPNPPPGRGSSDFGNFSQVIPGIHPYFSISTEKIAAHTPEFCTAAGSDYGFHSAMAAAEALAETAWKFLTDADFRTAVKEDFDRPAPEI